MSQKSDKEDFANILARGGCLPPMDTPDRKKPSRNGHQQNGKPAGKRRTNRFTTINQFVDLHLRDTNGTDAKVWLTLWRHERDGIAELSHQQIADQTGLSRRTVIDAIERLTDKQLVRRVYRGGPNQEANKYQLTTPS